jgi:hypothetical protein
MPPPDTPAAENPYAAPQAALSHAVPSAAQRGVRWQLSYLRGAVRNTFYVNLVFILVVILAMLFIVEKERRWNHIWEGILGASLAVTMACWPIGMAVGCLAMVGDYLLQLFGWRKPAAPPEINPADERHPERLGS